MNRGALRVVALIPILFMATNLADHLLRSQWGSLALPIEDALGLHNSWIQTSLVVQPTHGSDRGGFQISYTAILDTGLQSNPYQDVHNLTLQVYKSGLRGLVANLSWDITGYPPIPGTHYTYKHTGMIPASLIEEEGAYILKLIPPPEHPSLADQVIFYFDDPTEVTEILILPFSIMILMAIRHVNGCNRACS